MTARVRLGVALGVLAALVGLAACSDDPTADDVAGRPTTTTEPASPTTQPPACEPRASYAPLDPRPQPGAMPAGSTMADIAARGKLRVGVSADTLYFGFRDNENQLNGFDIDLAREVAQAVFGDTADPDRFIEYTVMPYSGRIPALRRGDVDMVADIMTMNCVRWTQIAFSAEYYSATQRILVTKGSGIGSIDDLAGRKACAATTSTSEAKLKEHPEIERVIVAQVSDCMVLFQAGEVDAIVGDDTVVRGFAEQDDQYAEVVGASISDEPYGLGFNQDAVDFVRFVNSVLAQIEADGTWARLYVENGLGEPAPAPPTPDYGRG